MKMSEMYKELLATQEAAWSTFYQRVKGEGKSMHFIISMLLVVVGLGYVINLVADALHFTALDVLVTYSMFVLIRRLYPLFKE